MRNLDNLSGDIRLLKHWLWINAKCVIVLMVLVSVIRFGHAPGSQCTEYDFQMHASATAGVEITLAGNGGVRAVPPSGWRRTRHGWQHTSTWTGLGESMHSYSISELVAMQKSQEPRWMQTALGRIRRIPPLMVAVLQITAVAVIFNVNKKVRHSCRV